MPINCTNLCIDNYGRDLCLKIRNTIPSNKIEPVDQSKSESAEEVNEAIGINWRLWYFSSLPGMLGRRDGASQLLLGGSWPRSSHFGKFLGNIGGDSSVVHPGTFKAINQKSTHRAKSALKTSLLLLHTNWLISHKLDFLSLIPIHFIFLLLFNWSLLSLGRYWQPRAGFL